MRPLLRANTPIKLPFLKVEDLKTELNPKKDGFVRLFVRGQHEAFKALATEAVCKLSTHSEVQNIKFFDGCEMVAIDVRV